MSTPSWLRTRACVLRIFGVFFQRHHIHVLYTMDITLSKSFLWLCTNGHSPKFGINKDDTGQCGASRDSWNIYRSSPSHLLVKCCMSRLQELEKPAREQGKAEGLPVGLSPQAAHRTSRSCPVRGISIPCVQGSQTRYQKNISYEISNGHFTHTPTCKQEGLELIVIAVSYLIP